MYFFIIQINRLEAVIRDRDSDLEKKSSQVETLKTDKMHLDSDLADVRYENEVSTRKLGLMQKKVRAFFLVISNIDLKSPFY